ETALRDGEAHVAHLRFRTARVLEDAAVGVHDVAARRLAREAHGAAEAGRPQRVRAEPPVEDVELVARLLEHDVSRALAAEEPWLVARRIASRVPLRAHEEDLPDLAVA